MPGDVRWRGYTHQELYDAIHSGPGAAASAAPAPPSRSHPGGGGAVG